METFTPETRDLVLKRLEQYYAEGKLTGVYTLGGRSYTPEQMIDEVRNGTAYGNEIIFAQKQFMDELMRR